MEETESDRTMSELVVKELVEQGLDSSMRDSILEAVEESEGDTGGSRNLPIAGALVGVGAALGYLAGRESTDLEDVSLEDVEEPEIIDDVTGGDEDEDAESESEEAEAEAAEAETETEADVEDGGSSGILGRLLLAVGLLVGLAVLRRRFGGDADEEWEPIEEFEPATEIDADEEDEFEGVDEDEELEAETDDSEE
ncbi:hypothetical protein C491_20791 [Natronococcus amylolyticus DSM 10524]|uniref:Uncharacterized protein n=1 Tax=Natronococcus amylolyticus DSM 10524 TaxID=1227497 RepID=L9WWE4_9EURY|nr:hypothetical protein [Natronococcus amylolyticus]ELY53785.1 hypothetical protein C491_20791 [Natronococcus amylolyticus DSM 10524]